jgi:putative transposase
VSRVWRKVKADWDAWNARSLAEEPIVRLILDGTVVRVRLDRKATSMVLRLRRSGVNGEADRERPLLTSLRRASRPIRRAALGLGCVKTVL